MTRHVLAPLFLIAVLVGLLSLLRDPAPTFAGEPVPGDRPIAAVPLRFVPECNLQVGIPYQRLPHPISVRTRPGARVEFFSPDMGTFVESGGPLATVEADEAGRAAVHLRLGASTGEYTVVAKPAAGDGPALMYRFRALSARQMKARAARFDLTEAPETDRAAPGKEGAR